jgi:hypothetical protein
VTLAASAPSTSASALRVTYTVAAPDAQWRASTVGRYTITLAANTVRDTSGHAVVAGALGHFTVVEHRVMLPLMWRTGMPDLAVSSVSLSPSKTSLSAGESVEITVVVENRGTAPATDFWVDLSINPDQPPTSANQPWNEHCTLMPCYGLAWYVPELAPGARITLTSKTLPAGYSNWPGFFATGTTDLYVYADSWNPNGRVGTVVESDEANNQFHRGGLVVTGPNPSQASLQTAAARVMRPVHLRK